MRHYPTMNAVPISPYTTALGMIYFPRMLDKIRKFAASQLREDFVENLGKGFDGRCCGYLRVSYTALQERTLAGGTDEAILQWCFDSGRPLSEEDIYLWNEFLRKVGWNDAVSKVVARRKADAGLQDRDDIQTMLEFLEVDEGRKA